MLIWIGGAVIAGLILGVTGYFFPKASWGFFMGALFLFGLFSNMVFDQRDMMAAAQGQPVDMRVESSEVAEDVLSAGQIYATAGLRTSNNPVRDYLRIVNNFDRYPLHIQYSLFALVISFFIARFFAWSGTNKHREAVAYRKASETKEDKRARILAEYGMR